MNRKLVGGIAAMIGAVSFIGAGTLALWSDTETSGALNFESGSLDMGPITALSIDAENIAPGDGDSDAVVLDFTNTSVDALVDFSAGNFVDAELGCFEPEDQAEGGTGCGTDGELDSDLNVTISYDADGAGAGLPLALFSGVASDLSTWDPTPIAITPGSNVATLIVNWGLPTSSGNETQTDQFSFDITAELTSN
jgi:predicted ribosomally synthesized peptide with SipW-like signal peptide